MSSYIKQVKSFLKNAKSDTDSTEEKEEAWTIIDQSSDDSFELLMQEELSIHVKKKHYSFSQKTISFFSKFFTGSTRTVNKNEFTDLRHSMDLFLRVLKENRNVFLEVRQFIKTFKDPYKPVVNIFSDDSSSISRDFSDLGLSASADLAFSYSPGFDEYDNEDHFFADGSFSQERDNEEEKVVIGDEIDEKEMLALRRGLGKKVKDFVLKLYKEMVRLPNYSDATELQKEELGECIERYVVLKVHKFIYIINKLDDWNISHIINQISYITTKHLDIEYDVPESLILDCSEILSQINFFKTPRNKLFCISSCTNMIFDFLSKLTGSNAGVDEFLPLLTYIIIKTNVPHLQTNIGFISDFRDDQSMLSSSGFLVTNFSIALHYIETIDEEDLAAAYERNDRKERIHSKYTFVNATPEDLAPEDIKKLLKEYRALVDKEIELTTIIEKIKPSTNL